MYIELNKQFTIDEINIDKPNLNKYFSNIEICLSLLEGEICCRYWKDNVQLINLITRKSLKI